MNFIQKLINNLPLPKHSTTYNNVCVSTVLMHSEYDTVLEHYDELTQKPFTDEAQRQAYLTRLTALKDTATVIKDFRDTLADPITSTSYAPEMPITEENCAEMYDDYINRTDEEHASYNALTTKRYRIKALIYIHWRFNHLSINEPHATPTKLSFVQAITKKLVSCALHWGLTPHTTTEKFLHMQFDIRDDQPLEEILDNFHEDDLVCYGF